MKMMTQLPKYLLQPSLTATLLGTVVFSSLCLPGSARAASQSYPSLTEDNMITRVEENSDSDLTHSYFVDSQGNTYTDTSSSKTTTLKKAANLPSSYDLRDLGLVTSIKDQGVTGCCWAFSAIKVIESNCIKNGLFSKDTIDFSENHLTWFSYHPSTNANDSTYWDGIHAVSSDTSSLYSPSPFGSTSSSGTTPYETGGSAILANFTLAKWSGAELESAAPFTGDTSAQMKNMASSMQQKSNLLYDSYAHLQNVFNFDEYSIGSQYYYKDTAMIARMQQAIMDYGAMSVSLYYDKTYLQNSPQGSCYYQNYYVKSTAVKNANHSVTIVGWDDTFSRNNFSRQPEGDGAWLIANSYGTDVGDQGYFWLSYYDQSICDCSSFLMESADNYSYIYQYDGFGWGTANYSNSQNLKAANIFTVSGEQPQQLQAVSFYTLTDDQPYKIQIYRGVGDAPTDGTLIEEATTQGTATNNGYHTITLASPVNIDGGERFSVVVTYLQDGTDTVYVPLEGTDTTESSLNVSYSSQKGQSFIYTKLTGSSGNNVTQWIDTSTQGYNNVCIKAFTNTGSTAQTLPRVIQTVKLGKGESFQITGEYSSYVSNDTSLLAVSSSGKVTAKKRGITSVKVSDETGTYLIRFKIKKAPAKITLTPSGKKTVKKGKQFTLKVKLPSGSASYQITYRSSNTKVAKTDNTGKVYARRKGTATITVRTFNKKKATLRLTVR